MAVTHPSVEYVVVKSLTVGNKVSTRRFKAALMIPALFPGVAALVFAAISSEAEGMVTAAIFFALAAIFAFARYVLWVFCSVERQIVGDYLVLGDGARFKIVSYRKFQTRFVHFQTFPLGDEIKLLSTSGKLVTVEYFGRWR